MSKLPSFQFYPGDWMKDPALRSCTVAARGLWIDLVCLMFECPERGVLARADGTPFTNREISRATGVGLKVVNRLVGELSNAGVLQRNSRGATSSRRLQRDELRRAADAERKALARKTNNLGQFVRNESEVCPENVRSMSHRTSSSSSSSTSTSVNKINPPINNPPKPEKKKTIVSVQDIKLPPNLDTETGRAAMAEWLDYKRERRESYKNTRGLTALFGLFKDLTDRDFQQAIQASIASNYAGVFPPRAATQSPMFKTQDRPLTTAQKTQEVLNRRLQKLRGNHDRSTDDSIVDVSGEVLE